MRPNGGRGNVDGVTADFFPCDMSFLARTATGVINEVKGVNRVVYDVTSKPPGTIRVGVTSPLASGARICRRASVFKALGAKFCNFRGTPTRRRGGSTGRRAKFLGSPARIPYVGGRRFRGHTISGRGSNLFSRSRRHFRPACDRLSTGDRRPQGLRLTRSARNFRARIQSFQPLAVTFPAVLHGPAEPRGQGTLASLRSGGRPVERPGRERGRRSEARRGRACGSILSLNPRVPQLPSFVHCLF